jgi:predicted nuclease of predicted toxin-antitoxin system
MLAQHGHDATHTLDLTAGNATKDRAINQLSIDQQRAVISKDTDFFYSHLLHGRPWKLLLVKTGAFRHAICRLCLSATCPLSKPRFKTTPLWRSIART